MTAATTAVSAKSPPPKQRQARAEATRARLLTSTVAVLIAKGYAGTTTQAVCRHSECSRGTLLYHFPTREALLVAALHQVLADRVQAFVAGASAPLQVGDFIAALWQQWRGEAYTAWLELAVAARTNPTLRAPLRETMSLFDEMIVTAFAALVPDEALPKDFAGQAPFLLFALFNGLAVGKFYEPAGRAEPCVDVIVALADENISSPIGGKPWKS